MVGALGPITTDHHERRCGGESWRQSRWQSTARFCCRSDSRRVRQKNCRSIAPGTWLARILSTRSSPALPLAEPLASGNLLADLVASISRNDQTHHHPTVRGRGECAARPSLYRGEDDVSEGAALHDRGDVVDEDGVGVAMILDRQSFDVADFHRSPPSTATCVPAWSRHRRLRLARPSAPAATDRWIAHDLTAVF